MTVSMKTPPSETEIPKRAFAIRKRTNKVNAVISDELRERLLELITETNSIRRAALQLGINSNTAKSIYYKFCKTGISKKLVRTRKDYMRDFVAPKIHEPFSTETPAEMGSPAFTPPIQTKFQIDPVQEGPDTFANLSPPFKPHVPEVSTAETLTKNSALNDLAAITLNFKMKDKPSNSMAPTARNSDAFEDYYSKSNEALSQLKRSLQFSLSLEAGLTSMPPIEPVPTEAEN